MGALRKTGGSQDPCSILISIRRGLVLNLIAIPLRLVVSLVVVPLGLVVNLISIFWDHDEAYENDHFF
jgi:hypothetical protein